MDNTEQSQSIFDALYDPFAIPRKKMVPVWIKVFCWIFIVIGTVGSLGILVMSILSKETNISIYGFSTTESISLIGLAGTFLYMYKALVAYGLLAGKDWAVTCAIIDGWLGVVLCIVAMCTGSFITGYDTGTESGFHMRIEIFFIIPYLYKMYRIKDDWRENVYARQMMTGATLPIHKNV